MILSKLRMISSEVDKSGDDDEKVDMSAETPAEIEE
jgi:hypothetical protein